MMRSRGRPSDMAASDMAATASMSSTTSAFSQSDPAAMTARSIDSGQESSSYASPRTPRPGASLRSRPME